MCNNGHLVLISFYFFLKVKQVVKEAVYKKGYFYYGTRTCVSVLSRYDLMHLSCSTMIKIIHLPPQNREHHS
jgi:hypothetical protein